MTVTSFRLVVRGSITAAVVGLFVLGFAAPQPRSETATVRLADGGEDRLGCGDYCQTAGGYGGAGNAPHTDAAVVARGTVTADPDGYVPVTVTCRLSVQCRGVLMAGTVGDALHGRSDLVVNAAATRTIGVPLGSSFINLVKFYGPENVYVTADASQSTALNGFDGVGAETPLTVVAPG
jgi:hypothetical protein